MRGDDKGDAEGALADLSITVGILEAMCVADLSAGHKLCPASVDWLVGQQEALCTRIEEAIARGWNRAPAAIGGDE